MKQYEVFYIPFLKRWKLTSFLEMTFIERIRFLFGKGKVEHEGEDVQNVRK